MAPSITIASSQLSAAISPLGAELRALTTSAGEQLLWNGDPAFWTARSPILFPNIGELAGGVYRYDGQSYAMPKHGFARRSSFAVIAAEADRAVLRLSASDATRAVYPFEFALDLAYALAGAQLTMAATIANHGARAMPASFGFHPALRWPLPFGASRAEHRLRFAQDEPAAVRRIDAQGLLRPAPEPSPVIGNRLALNDGLFTDDALIFDQLSSRAVSYGADHGAQLHVGFADFPALGVWTKPGAGFICIEPWQGCADPVDFSGDIGDKPGIMMIEPGETRRLTMTITLQAGCAGAGD